MTKKLVIELEEQIHREFKTLCFHQETAMKDIVTDFIIKYIDKQKKEVKKK